MIESLEVRTHTRETQHEWDVKVMWKGERYTARIRYSYNSVKVAMTGYPEGKEPGAADYHFFNGYLLSSPQLQEMIALVGPLDQTVDAKGNPAAKPPHVNLL